MAKTREELKGYCNVYDDWKRAVKLMIEVFYGKNKYFQEWYYRKVLERIKERKETFANDKVIQEFIDRIKIISDEEIKNILCFPRETLEQIDWICEYLRLADFIGSYSSFRKSCIGKEAKEKRSEYLKKYSGCYLNDLHKGKLAFHSKSWEKFDKLKIKATKLLDKLNLIIRKRFDYKLLDAEFRQELFSKMEVKVCPYCNQQYIPSIGKDKYLGDFDHVYPQSVYALFSLSLWNLVPSCKACNQTLKRDGVRDLLNPTQQGFGKDAIFQVCYGDSKSIRGESNNFECGWKIQKRAKPMIVAKIKNNIEVFRLNDIYQAHKGKIKDVLKKKYCLDERFFEDCKKKLNIESDEGLYYSIYGCSLNPKKFKDEILSKMTYDIVKNG